ncbi:hypothetical protein [Oceanobacter mangrovi]|uniref:hypothetical protein n=1 Tax=Oceanobacter mangrovi TaxID=2862510 RepID=UPI001C8D4EDF|nr:hypothetical protein [Oceanobacter mangrovi]
MLNGLDALIEKQQSIYLNAFKHPMAQPELQLTGADRKPESGLLVVARYSHELSGLLAEASQLVADTIPAICFTPDTVYTGLIVGPRLHDLDHSEAEAMVLQTQRWFFEDALPIGRELRKQVQFQFTDWLFNSNTLIAASKANNKYWELAQLLASSAEQAGISANIPWGSHVTVSRFVANQLPSEELRSAVQQLPKLPTEVVTPIGMDLIRYECDNHAFRLISSDVWSS